MRQLRVSHSSDDACCCQLSPVPTRHDVVVSQLLSVKRITLAHSCGKMMQNAVMLPAAMALVGLVPPLHCQLLQLLVQLVHHVGVLFR